MSLSSDKLLYKLLSAGTAQIYHGVVGVSRKGGLQIVTLGETKNLSESQTVTPLEGVEKPADPI